MAVQFSTALRNSRADLIESSIGTSPKLYIYSGAKPTNVSDSDPSGLLIMLTLPSDWESAASSGAKALAGTWSGTATGTGTPASFRVKDSSGTSSANTGTTFIQGSSGVGSGDLSFDGSITTGQTVTVTTFSITEGNV